MNRIRKWSADRHDIRRRKEGGERRIRRRKAYSEDEGTHLKEEGTQLKEEGTHLKEGGTFGERRPIWRRKAHFEEKGTFGEGGHIWREHSSKASDRFPYVYCEIIHRVNQPCDYSHDQGGSITPFSVSFARGRIRTLVPAHAQSTPTATRLWA